MVKRGCHSFTACLRFLALRYWRIVPAIGLFVVLFLMFRQSESTQEQDRWLLLAMAVGFFLTSVMMLRYNIGWPLIDVGVLFLCMGSATIWWLFADSIEERRRLTENENDIVRALFVTALIILFSAYPWWIYRRHKRNGWDGVTERRRGPGRRDADHL